MAAGPQAIQVGTSAIAAGTLTAKLLQAAGSPGLGTAVRVGTVGLAGVVVLGAVAPALGEKARAWESTGLCYTEVKDGPFFGQRWFDCACGSIVCITCAESCHRDCGGRTLRPKCQKGLIRGEVAICGCRESAKCMNDDYLPGEFRRKLQAADAKEAREIKKAENENRPLESTPLNNLGRFKKAGRFVKGGEKFYVKEAGLSTDLVPVGSYWTTDDSHSVRVHFEVYPNSREARKGQAGRGKRLCSVAAYGTEIRWKL